jgi:hypothetical protein
MNKKILLLFSTTIIFLLPVPAQLTYPLKKLYAYKQAGIPGIQPGVTGEAGDKQKGKRKESFNYWFYLVFSKSGMINITGLWLSGKKFTVKTEPITELPVKKINYTSASGNDTVTLVPFTKNAVLLTYPAGEDKDTAAVSKYLSDLVSKNELVITYYWKGKKFYKVSRKITVLDPEAKM